MSTISQKPQLIMTGGTLSMSKNAEGKYVPDDHSLDTFANELGYDSSLILRPYTIDSIDFDIHTHYPKLLDAAKTALDAGHTPIVCGGTDSQPWYATLLTKDLMRQGYLQPESGQKIIFLSSMKSLEEGPDHVRAILKAGKTIADENLTGGFAVSAQSEAADSMVIHDVLNHFDKISASLVNPFRSESPVGYLIHNTFNACEAYVKPETPPPAMLDAPFARIAPPFLHKQDSKALITYLKSIAASTPAFDGVLIEGMPNVNDGTLYKSDSAKLPAVVQQLTEKGMRVIFCNQVRYDENKRDMSPMLPAKTWADGGVADSLKTVGAEFVVGMPKDIYLDMMLMTPKRQPQDPIHVQFPTQRQRVVGLRYVPNVPLMAEASSDITHHTKNLLFSALPNSALPADFSIAAPRGVKAYRTFEYNGTIHFDSERLNDFEETPTISHYAAGQGSAAMPLAGSDPIRSLAHHGSINGKGFHR